MQDTSANAMTEVALGLSMAFFSLMIVALVSVSLPQSSSLESENLAPKINANRLQLEAQNQELTSDTAQERAFFLFYYEGTFYNQALEPTIPAQISTESPIVLAIAPNVNIEEALALQKVFGQKSIQITSMNQDWLTAVGSRSAGH
ncbi:hypothetical protein [Glaciecola sp. 1036]|uniref:hypothetical protein n=1 Tax=Alteromonadaceae TaxID=72275 RepID=UPI003CFE30CB